MKQKFIEPKFGEKEFDEAVIISKVTGKEEKRQGSTTWGPRYASARATAESLIKKFGLSEEDFWIKKDWNWNDNVVIYSNLILSHAGCELINQQLKPENKFKPSSVKEGRGTDGGVVLFYISDEQGIFDVGEASFRNNKFPFVYNIAKNRLFDKVVLKNAGATGIYGEEESEAFAKYKNVSPEAPQQAVPATPMSQAFASQPTAPMPQQMPAQMAPQSLDPAFMQRIADLETALTMTNSNMDKFMERYGVFSLEELTPEDLSEAESLVRKKLQRQQALQQAQVAATSDIYGQPQQAAPAPQVFTAPMPQQMPPQPHPNTQGISPIAAAMMAQQAQPQSQANTPQQAVAPAPSVTPTPTAGLPLGLTIYSCLEGAPEQFSEMEGKTFDEITKDYLRPLFGRKNAFGRRYVSPEMLEKIVEYISA